MVPAPIQDEVVGRGVALRPRRCPVPVGGINPVLPAALQGRMRSNEPSLIQNANLVRQLVYLDYAPSPVGNAVVIAADRHQAVMADAAFQFEELVKRHGG
jgi:hypothetical protein